MPRHRSNDDAHFAAPPSFMGVPFSRDLAGSKAAILGIPFDCGTHAVRIGSRLGPAAIREQSALVRPYEPPLFDFNPVERLGLVDCGNVRLVPSRIEEAFATIAAAVSRIAGPGTIPL